MGNRMPDEENARSKRQAAAMNIDADAFRKSRVSKKKRKAQEDTLPRKLFRAGYFSPDARQQFLKFQVITIIVLAIIIPTLFYAMSGQTVTLLLGAVMGLLIGYLAPRNILDRKIKQREEEILYFLPLVIEQVSIGVSSALDVGPCISQIVSMASERDSHNAVTEMFGHAEKLIRSGLSLEESLIEVAEANGMQEIKHAFMFLAQVSRHGGEISKQLQELADAVTTQRQLHIEGQIAKLPVKATGPLGMVFAGFFAILFAGLFVRLLTAFGSGVSG